MEDRDLWAQFPPERRLGNAVLETSWLTISGTAMLTGRRAGARAFSAQSGERPRLMIEPWPRLLR